LPRYDSFQFLIRRLAESDPYAIDFAEISNFEMSYRDHFYINHTIALMRRLADLVASDQNLRDKLLVGLMLRFHGWTKRKTDGPTCHAELQAYLTKFL